MSVLSIFTVIYISDYANFAWWMNSLIANLYEEERIQLWSGAWKMLKDNSLITWIAGNGIGSVRVLFPKYSVYEALIFPHGYFLEILCDNGIIGFILIFGGLGFLFYAIIKKIKYIVDKKMSMLLKCMATLFLIWFIHCGLVTGFYSNYSLYPLGFILGTTLVLMERIPRDGVVQKDNQG
jgi:O-antigen ligase